MSTQRNRRAADLGLGDGASSRPQRLPPSVVHLFRADHVRGLPGGLHLQHVLCGPPRVGQQVVHLLKAHGFCWAGGDPVPHPAPPSTQQHTLLAREYSEPERCRAQDQPLPVSPVTWSKLSTSVTATQPSLQPGRAGGVGLKMEGKGELC